MDSALWIARIFGPLFFIGGIWMLLKKDEMQKMIESVRGNQVLFYLAGMLNLFFGFFILSTYSTWSFSLALLVTLIGWVFVIRGLLILFVPDKVMQWADMLANRREIFGYIPLVLGILLCLFAFA